MMSGVMTPPETKMLRKVHTPVMKGITARTGSDPDSRSAVMASVTPRFAASPISMAIPHTMMIRPHGI